MTSTNPAFASNLYDSTYSGDSEGARNPVYEAGAGGSTPAEGKSNPLFSSNILDSSESQQVRSPALASSACLSETSLQSSCRGCMHALAEEQESILPLVLRLFLPVVTIDFCQV